MKKPEKIKKPTKRAKRKINWPVYNRMLKNRGALTVWFSKDVIHSLYNMSEVSQKGRGFQKIYSDTAIEVLSLIRFQFHLTLRSLEGFSTSLMKIMDLSDMYRMKVLFGERMLSRKFANQVNEAFLKCRLLNMMPTPKVL